MDRQQHAFVAGALVALVSVSMGAGAVASASMLISGYTPRAAQEAGIGRFTHDGTERGAILRERFETDKSEPLERATRDQQVHGAAPTRMSVEELTERCYDLRLTRTRLSHCLGEADNGVKYQLSQLQE